MPELPLNSDVKPSVATADDILDLFNEPDKSAISSDDKDDSLDTKGDDIDDIEDDGDKKEPKELELIDPDEDDAEKLDLTKPDDDIDVSGPPRKREILKEYPEIFKKFPYLEKILYRDKEYTALFGSFDDAKEVAERAEHFSNVENQLLAGNTEDVLRSVKDTDEKAFNIIVDDYLPTLLKVDKDAYFHVVSNLNKRLIMEMWKEASDSDDDDLKRAAIAVNQFLFNTKTFTPPTKKVDRSQDEKTNVVEQERLNFVKERFETSRDDLQTQVDNTLRATIAEYIDPRGTMSPYVKKNAVTDALKNLTKIIGDDPSVSRNLNKLWENAFDEKFSKDSLNKIKSYYLGRAKPNLRKAIQEARAEALKDASPRSRATNDDEERPSPTRRTIPSGRPSQPKKDNGMKKGESVQDFFMRDN